MQALAPGRFHAKHAPAMAVWKRHARLLCLLATAQLLGGPLVLALLLTVCQPSADQPFEQRLARSWQQVEALSAGGVPADWDAGVVPDRPTEAPSPKKTGFKDTTWTTEAAARLQLVPPPALPLAGWPSWRDPVPPSQANAPPLPPPRWS